MVKKYPENNGLSYHELMNKLAKFRRFYGPVFG